MKRILLWLSLFGDDLQNSEIQVLVLFEESDLIW